MTKTRHYKGYTITYHHNGITISVINDADGQYLHQLYQGYSFRESIELFSEYVLEYNSSLICEEV